MTENTDMVTAFKQTVTVKPGGRIEFSSPELRAGTKAEVIVLLGRQKQQGRIAQSRPALTVVERRKARRRLERFAGAVNSGDPQSSDNDKIDADLAREYENTHEEER
jgi:hypothetical protein